jgi:hypothetical protein
MGKKGPKPNVIGEYAVEPGSIPLKTRKMERYAQERALFNSPTVAAQHAGYNGFSRIVAAQLERKPYIQARIAYLSRDDESALKRKRERLETILWDSVSVDRADFYETVNIPITDREGKAILDKDGNPKIRQLTQLRPLEQLSPAHRGIIESIAYTESGKPNLKLVSKEYAHRELRRMLGGDAEQGQVIGAQGEFSGYSDTELFSELSRMANQLGLKMTLSIEAGSALDRDPADSNSDPIESPEGSGGDQGAPSVSALLSQGSLDLE